MSRSFDLIANSENDKLYKSFLERYFFSRYREGIFMIEFFVRASCPSKCSYCYLQQYKDELYPPELEDHDTIVANAKKFLNFYSENKFKCDFELFSGRLFYDDLGFRILDVFYEQFKDELFYKPSAIIMPDDMQFLLDEDVTAKVEEYIDKFSNINISLLYSLSVDGKKVDYLRFGSRADDFYEKVFAFAKKHHFNFHPMVAATQADNMVENFKWWYEQEDFKIEETMFLEVRNDNWTPYRLDKFVELIDFIITKELDRLGSEEFYKQMVLGEGRLGYRRLIDLNASGMSPTEGLSCAIQNIMCLRLGDLSILPCHRTGRKQFISGRLITNEEGEIVQIEANNPVFHIAAASVTLGNLPKCQNCPINFSCLGPCLGSNFESTSDSFYPPKSVCNQQFTLAYMVAARYFQLGFLDRLKVDCKSKFDLVIKLLSYFINDSSEEAERVKKACSSHKLVIPEDKVDESCVNSSDDSDSSDCNKQDEHDDLEEVRNVFAKFSL